MAGKVGGGFAMVEVLAALALLGVALGGISRLTAGTARGAGEGDLRLQARLSALSALERGAFGCGKGPLRVERREAGGRREVTAVWSGGGSLRLGVWVGHG